MSPRFVLLALPLALAACSPVRDPTPDIRPVQVEKLSLEDSTEPAELSGEVRPRIETRAGFQIAGRIATRLVEVGQRVARGQTLATLDPTDSRLGAEAAAAQLVSARVDRDQLRSDLARYKELHRKGFVGDAELERHQNQLDAAQARFDQAQAQASVSANQADYATLRAPAAGVVTAIESEVGQVVAAGQPVIRLALGDEKEVVVGIPENRLQSLGHPQRVRVRLWADGDLVQGRPRELSPVADPATRTYAMKVSLVDAPPRVALGMTASVLFDSPGEHRSLALPLQALLHEGEQTYAWRLDPATSTVQRVPVRIGAPAGNRVEILDGLRAGDTIVTAGVHLLAPGQKVRLVTP